MVALKDFDAWTRLSARIDDIGLEIGGHQVMQFWEHPVMQGLAQLATRRGGDVLEIGFGLGLSAQYIVRANIHSYTVIELHPEIAQRAREWAELQTVPVKVIEAPWQIAISSLQKRYDGILFDTYPISSEEMPQEQFMLVSPFLSECKRLLNRWGVLTYYSGETTLFQSRHLALLLNNFSTVELHRIDGLQPPKSCTYWAHDHMVIPCCLNNKGDI
jgi:guanidinoacetate N-methyltransferase